MVCVDGCLAFHWTAWSQWEPMPGDLRAQAEFSDSL